MYSIKFALVLCALMGSTSLALALTLTELNPTVAFKMMLVTEPVSVIVPTVVEIPLSGVLLEQKNFLVYEPQSGKLLPSYFKEEYVELPEQLSVVTSETENTEALIDNDPKTNINFLLTQEGINTVDINVSSANQITSSKLILELDQNVSLPTTVALSIQGVTGTEQIIARKKVTSNVIDFPQTTSNEWYLTLEYEQPLRINELRFVQDSVEKSALRALRFLAQPNQTYVVYLNPDRTQNVPVPESGNLRSNEGVMVLAQGMVEENPSYTKADTDNDGIPDTLDNCKFVENYDQLDIDTNGTGDACDDFDRDGIINANDNCQNEPNTNQSDEDSDGIGDMCDDQESRLTERYLWVPWVGMGIALLVLIGLFALVGLKPKNTV